MTFYLVKNQEFQLGSDGTIEDDYCYRTVRLPVSAEPIDKPYKPLCQLEIARLKQLLDEVHKRRRLPGEPGQEAETDQQQPNATLDWKLNLTFGMTCKSGASKMNILVMPEAGEDNFLSVLQCVLEERSLKLMLWVDFPELWTVVKANGEETDVYFQSFATELGQVSSPDGATFNDMEEWNRKIWNPRSNCTYKGTISISCGLFTPVLQLSSILDGKKPSACQKILNREINSDAVIIAEDNVPVKCHRAFLSAQSSVFQTMFSGENFEESRTGTVEMPDMTEDGVRALLSHLYLQDDHNAKKNCDIALDLYQAGHKYDIPSLEESMEFILLNKSDDWYQVDVALQLFLYARVHPEGEKLKIKAMQVLKGNAAILETLPAYKQLFKNSPTAAMELCKYAFKM